MERSDLAALEFLMSKQPRGPVRVGTGNTVGARASNVFDDVKKIQQRFVKAMEKATMKNSKEENGYTEERMSAIQAIKSVSQWVYWQVPNARASTLGLYQNLIHIPQKSNEQDIKKLREAVAARKQARDRVGAISSENQHSKSLNHDEYWTPSRQALPASVNGYDAASKPAFKPLKTKKPKQKHANKYERRRRNSLESGFPVMTATIAAIIVRSQIAGRVAAGEVEEHIGGSWALTIVNSSWMQVLLAGLTWYCVGIYVVDLVQTFRSWSK